MNRIWAILAGALLLPLLTACGGSGGAYHPASSAQLQGAVTELDGQTLNRDGVDITVVETGDHIMTRADGSFSFPNLEPGWYTLQFDAPGPVTAFRVRNTLLFELFDDQRNAVKFVHFPDEAQKTYSFAVGEEEFEVRF